MVPTESRIVAVNRSGNRPRTTVLSHCGLLGTLALMFLLVACGKDNLAGSGQPSVIIDTLLVAEDVHIQSDVPDGCYGTGTELSVVTVVYVGGTTVEHRAYVKLPPLPSGLDLSRLNWADLELTYTGADSSRLYAVKAYQVQDDWNEGSVTWNTSPSSDSVLFDSARVSNHKLTIKVASIYRTGDPDKGIILTTIDGMEQVFYSSEAADSSLVPIIEIGYAPQ